MIGEISWLVLAVAMGLCALAAGAISSVGAAISTLSHLQRPGQMELYVANDPKSLRLPPTNHKLAKFEPESGCYLGAYIELDPLLKSSFVDQNMATRKIPSEFEEIVGKRHAMYFFYLGYGTRLPVDWVRYLVSQGKLVHIALEPNLGLQQVQDDDYLRTLADDMARSKAKIFLRFASEMNGPWTAYHGDPELYTRKFRLVAQIMRKRAPNVAMVWCPYSNPQRTIPSYYPGDEWTDWVGVNMYNVTYFNQDPTKPAENVRPREMLDFVYKMYSARKPIMICEYATTHFSALEGKSVIDFACDNIDDLYFDLRKNYKRVKAINYFDSNNLLVAHRRNNNYTVTSDPRVLEAYKTAVRSEYFLTGPPQSEVNLLPSRPVEFKNGFTLTGRVRVKAWSEYPIEAMKARFLVNGKRLAESEVGTEKIGFWLDTRELPPGMNRLTAEAYDASGKLRAWRAVDFEVIR